MNQTQALAKLRKLLGPKMGYRIDPKALDAEARASKSREAIDLRTRTDALAIVMNKRRDELLSDPTYQALLAESKRLKEALDTARYHAYQKRIVVGIDGGLFFSVKAEGDTWDEVVEKLVPKKAEVES